MTVETPQGGISHKQGEHANGSSGAFVLPLPVCAPDDEFAAHFEAQLAAFKTGSIGVTPFDNKTVLLMRHKYKLHFKELKTIL